MNIRVVCLYQTGVEGYVPRAAAQDIHDGRDDFNRDSTAAHADEARAVRPRDAP